MPNDEQQIIYDVNAKPRAKLMGMIFLYALVALLISGIVAVGISLLFTYFLPINEEANALIYYVIIGVSAFALIGMMIWIQIGVFRNKTKHIVIPFIIYACLMGFFLSSFTLFIDFYTIAIAFGITCLCFLAMFLVGYFSKANLNYLGIVIGFLFMGAFLLMGINFLMMFFAPVAWTYLDWIVTFVFFVAIMLITAVDVFNIRRLIDSGMMTQNLALYCAFNIYVDFIYIFIRVLAIIIRSRR